MRVNVVEQQPLPRADRNALAISTRGTKSSVTFVMCMRTSQEWHSVQHMFLKPLEPQINDRRDKQRDQLREDQAADDNQTKRTTRCSILSKTEGERNRTHQCRQ